MKTKIACLLSVTLILMFTNCLAQNLADLFDIDNALLVQDTINGRYKIKRQKNVYNGDYSHSMEYQITKSDDSDNIILIVAKENIYDDLKPEILRYAADIHSACNVGVIIEKISNETFSDIRSLLISYISSSLAGAVFIGDIDAAYFEVANDHGKYGYMSWPCDLYYMDIDGTWTDNDSNGIFDEHSGNVTPEIFIGRISAANMGNLVGEIEGLRTYFSKNHNFWLGRTSINEASALAYTNADWTIFSQFSTDISLLYGTTYTDICQFGTCSNFGKNNYLQNIADDTYEFIQLAAHSSPTDHRFDCTTYEYLYPNDIFSTINQTIGYNLFCCSACNWDYSYTNGYMGGSYLYNNSKCLFVVGSTKIGSMLGFNYFYSPLGNRQFVGEALKAWWIDYCGSYHDINEIYWHYGMTILGDPMISLKYNTNNTCNETISLNTFDNNDLSNIRYIKASEQITIGTNYSIPSGVTVILDAPQININPYFTCPLGASLEIYSDGCMSNH